MRNFVIKLGTFKLSKQDLWAWVRDVAIHQLKRDEKSRKTKKRNDENKNTDNRVIE